MPGTNNRPLLTFALCAYNQERFIREGVQAALSQTYSPLEIILSDDCSPDRTFEIMSEMAAQYRGPHRIVLNRNPVNFGLGKHLNRIVELVHGEFMVVAAGDDISTPNRVEIMYQAWENSGRKARAIQCGTIDIDDNGAVLGIRASVGPDQKLEATEQRPSLDDYVRTLKPGIFGCALGYDPQLFSMFGPVPDELIHEDNVVALRAFILGPMLFLNLPLLQRRIHGNNIFSRIYERVATSDGVARQEARFTRDARNRMVLYEAFMKDLRVAAELKLISAEQHDRLDGECRRIRGWFSCQSEYATAGLFRKLKLLISLWRGRADTYFIKWMLPRLLPSRIFQGMKVCLNSVRLFLSQRLAPGAQKRWT